jgi:hypothetical protein
MTTSSRAGKILGDGALANQLARPEEGDEPETERAETLHLTLRSWIILWASPVAADLPSSSSSSRSQIPDPVMGVVGMRDTSM